MRSSESSFIYLDDFLKEPAPVFVFVLFFYSLYISFCLYLVDFSVEFDYFLPSTPLRCICLFLF